MMPKTFEVPTTYGEKLTINPLNVTFLRTQQVKVAIHDPECFEGNPDCRVQAPGVTGLPDATCGWSEPQEATEICFVNTVGPQSAVTSTMEKREVANLLDEALRYDR
jgi:hypothetical protein